jgi:hypothetical protein
VQYFDIGPDATRVASISYSSASRLDFNFKTHTNKAALKSAIANLAYLGGGTETYKALESARTEVFGSTFSGVRPLSEGIPKVAVVLTDGTSRDSTETINQGILLRDLQNVNIFPIGVGNVKDQELEGIASLPVDEHYYKLNSISNMPDFVSKLASYTCNEPGIITSCDEVTTTIAQGDFRYFKRLLQGTSLVVEVDDVVGSTNVFISTTQKNPGPYDNIGEDTSGSARKVMRSSQSSTVVYIALQGRSAGESKATVNVYSDLYPDVAEAVVVLQDTLPAGSHVYQMPKASISGRMIYTLRSSGGNVLLPFKVSPSGLVTTTAKLDAGVATEWLFNVVANPSSSSSSNCVRGSVPVAVTVKGTTTTTSITTTSGTITSVTATTTSATATTTSVTSTTDTTITTTTTATATTRTTVATGPDDPTLTMEVCTIEEQQTCGTTVCVVPPNGGRPACANPPDPEGGCTPAAQATCGEAACTPLDATATANDNPAGQVADGSVKCTALIFMSMCVARGML